MRILIVDDEIDSREMLRVLLRLDGHDVDTAAKVEEAWKLFQDNEFSAVISDWVMPEGNGLELCRRIRASDTPTYCYIILLTALKGKANYLEAMRAGVDDFVTKPYDPDELSARLVAPER